MRMTTINVDDNNYRFSAKIVGLSGCDNHRCDYTELRAIFEQDRTIRTRIHTRLRELIAQFNGRRNRWSEKLKVSCDALLSARTVNYLMDCACTNNE